MMARRSAHYLDSYPKTSGGRFSANARRPGDRRVTSVLMKLSNGRTVAAADGSDHDERRRQILEAAVGVFGDAGFRKGTLRAIADTVGMTVQGVLHYFPTKESVLVAALDFRAESHGWVSDSPGGIILGLRRVLEHNLENPVFLRFFVTLAAEATDASHPAHSYFRARYANTLERVAEGYRLDITRGIVVDGDPVRIAEMLTALSDGLQLQALHHPASNVLATFDVATAALRR